MAWRDDNGCPRQVTLRAVLLVAIGWTDAISPVNFDGAKDAFG